MNLVDLVYKHAKGNEPDHVHPNEQKRRHAICKNGTVNGKKCLLPTGNCKYCGCFVKLKTQYKAEACPKGKW